MAQDNTSAESTSPSSPQSSQPRTGSVAEGAAQGAASSGVQGAATGGAGGVVADRVQGNSDSNLRRYAGAAAGGATDGAMQGGAHGAAVGAAVGVGTEATKDATKATSKIGADIKNNLSADPVDAKDHGSIKDNLSADPVDAKDHGSTKDNLFAEAADKRLAVGGTAFEADKGKQSAGGKFMKKAALGSAAATPHVTALVMLITFLKWLQTIFFAAMAAALNLLKLAWMAFVMVMKAVWGFITTPFVALGNVVASVAGFMFGGAVTATVATVSAVTFGTGSILALIIGIIAIFGGVFGLSGSAGAAANDVLCVAPAPPQGGAVATQNLSANLEAEAKKVYSVLKDWGMPNENIAGIMGNWSQESGIDPTSVENIFDEPYRIGPKKKAVWDGGFHTIETQSHDGIGLGGWSNDRTMSLLKYASAKGANWYDTTTQLAFMITDDYAESVGVVKDMIAHSKGTPSQAAVFFHDHWERSADDAEGIAEREADAEMWFGKISGWTVDQSAVSSVTNLTGSAISMISTGLNQVSPTTVVDPNDPCAGQNQTTTVVPTNGGMDQTQAQALMDLFNQEGDKFLDNRYPVGSGPSSNINCTNPEFTGHRRVNCVAFVAYFLNKYTKFQQYARGNGIETARTLSQMTGKPLTNIPTPYSVGSGPSSSEYGHTLIILSVQGDKVLVGEAGYCSFEGRVRETTVQALQSKGWQFVDMSDQMLPPDQIKTA